MYILNDECVGCEICTLGRSCPNLHVLRWYCNHCKKEVDSTNTGLCFDCFKDDTYRDKSFLLDFADTYNEEYNDFCQDRFKNNIDKVDE